MSDFIILEKILDSNDFTVGGGAASATAGAMAAALISMVARLSIEKEHGITKREYNSVIEEGDKLAQALIIGAEEDRQAFLKIKNAYTLPRGTESEKRERAIAIENGGISAAAVPQKNGLMCRKVYELGLLLSGQSNPSAKSDLEVGIMLARVGITGCILNIEANLPLIKNENIIDEFKRVIEELRTVKV